MKTEEDVLKRIEEIRSARIEGVDIQTLPLDEAIKRMNQTQEILNLYSSLVEIRKEKSK